MSATGGHYLEKYEENAMSISKRALLASGVGLVIALSTGAMAQTKGNAKSSEAETIGEGEALMIGP
jgi:hypothetical protein